MKNARLKAHETKSSLAINDAKMRLADLLDNL